MAAAPVGANRGSFRRNSGHRDTTPSSLPCTGLQPKSIGDSVAGRVSSRRLFIRSSVQLSKRGRMSRPFIYETDAF